MSTPVAAEHRGIRLEAVLNGAAATPSVDQAQPVAPDAALDRLREALDRIYDGSPLSASKIELLKRNGRVVLIFDPAFPKERMASVTIAAFFPDYFQHQGNMKDFVVVGRYGIKWPRDQLAAIIVHELVGHGLQHLRGRTGLDRKIDRECEARLYEEAAYQDFRMPRATPQMIRFRQDMERNWCADFRLFMRRHEPQSMTLWNYGTPKIPELLALFEEYLGRLRATGEAGRAVSASAEKRHREFLEFARKAEITNEPSQLFLVGTKYLHGVGVDKNIDRARDWLQKSAENGYPPAQQVLGEMAEKGVGAPPNITDAYFWYKLAARHGSVIGEGRAGRLEPHLSSRQRHDALGRVARWMAASGR